MEVTARWVELHLEPQSDISNMPETVVGLLVSETTSSYILNPMLDSNNNPVGMSFINRSYVWCCQVLDCTPELGETSTSEEDGL